MTFDTIIGGGTVATASDTFKCNVGIARGRIAALGENLGDAKELVNAAARLVAREKWPLAKPSGKSAWE